MTNKGIYITNHAALRFAQRIMGLDIDCLTEPQQYAIKCKILEVIASVYNYARGIDGGSIEVKDARYIIKDDAVVTITQKRRAEHVYDKMQKRDNRRKVKHEN